MDKTLATCGACGSKIQARLQERRRRLEECKREEVEEEAALEVAKAAALEVECAVSRLQKSMKRHGIPKRPTPARRVDQDLEQKEQERLKWELEWEATRKGWRLLDTLRLELHTVQGEELQAKHALEEARLLYFKEIQLALADERELRERNEWLELSVHLTRCRIDELERTEREGNAPIMSRLLEKAEAAWGPDHASRPPPRRI